MPVEAIRVLLVDDEEDFHVLIGHVLRKASIPIVFAAVKDPDSALTALASGGQDLLLVDYHLGALTGLDLLKRIREAGYDQPAILLTGRKDPNLDVRALEAGASDYIEKYGLEARTLERAIRYALGRHRDLQALKRSERTYRALMEQSTDAVFIADLRMNILDVNEQACQLQGYSHDEALKVNIIRDLCDPDDLAARPLRMEEMLSGNVVVSERRLKRKNGSWFRAEIRIRVIDGNRFQGVIRDITVQKTAEDKLRESEQYYRLLLENSRDMALIVSPDRSILYEAPSTQKILGREPGSMVGQNAFENMHPDDLPRVLEIFHKIMRVSGASESGEMRMRHADGSWRWVEASARNLVDHPLVRGIVINYRDITDRKIVEEKLRESEQYYRLLLENSRDVAIVIGPDRTVTYEAPSTRRVLGRQPGEMVGKNAFVNMHPEDLPRLQREFQKVLEHPGETITLDLRMRHSDGSWRWVEGNARNLMDHPLIRGVVINYRDVTERHEAEEALRRSERHFRSLIDNAFDVYGLLDAQGKILFESHSVERIMGRRSEDRIGKDGFDVIHPSDIPKVQEAFQRIQRAAGSVEKLFIQIRHADGTWRDVELMAQNLLSDPDVNGIVFNYRDITERKQAEEALQNSERYFRALIENAMDVIVMFDAAGHILYETPSIRKVLGYAPEERKGRKILELLHPDDLPRAQDLLRSLQGEPGKAIRSRLRLRHRDGSWRLIEGVGTNLLENPAVRGIILNYRDITEAQDAQDRLLKYERLATLGEITAGLAHEIRNPLATILSNAQYLKAKNSDPSSLASLDPILEQADRIRQLVSETLDYSKSSALHLEEIPIPALLGNALLLARTQYGPDHAKTKVEVQCPLDLPPLKADRRRLEQALVNLILNAFQALAPKGGQIVLSCGIIDGEIQLSVRDDGPGIRSEDLPKVFEPFFTTKRHGSGLGLSICQRMAQEHNGRVKVQRLEPGGTVFTIALPLKGDAQS